MNRKLSGFLKLADALDLFIVFGAVNSPVVQNTIMWQWKASVICQIIGRVTKVSIVACTSEKIIK